MSAALEKTSLPSERMDVASWPSAAKARKELRDATRDLVCSITSQVAAPLPGVML